MNSFRFTIVAYNTPYLYQHVRAISLQEASSKDSVHTSLSRVAINDAVLDANCTIALKEQTIALKMQTSFRVVMRVC